MKSHFSAPSQAQYINRLLKKTPVPGISFEAALDLSYDSTDHLRLGRGQPQEAAQAQTDAGAC
jgi:hypothetical protein